MNHRDYQIIRKILEEITISEQIIKDLSLEDFFDNELAKRAICMTVINIGELIKNISEETRLKNKHIPWKAIAGFRDITAHRYQTLRMDDVYLTVTQDFPIIFKQLKDIQE